jgi:hypothetical protein
MRWDNKDTITDDSLRMLITNLTQRNFSCDIRVCIFDNQIISMRITMKFAMNFMP